MGKSRRDYLSSGHGTRLSASSPDPMSTIPPSNISSLDPLSPTDPPAASSLDLNLPREYQIDLDLGFDRSTPSLDTDSCTSLQELETRLQELGAHVGDTHELVPLQHSRRRPLSGTTCSTNTLDNDDACVCYGSAGRPIPENVLADWPLDICRWVRTPSSKPEVLYRKHSADDRPKQSPLYKLSRPAQVAELLNNHADDKESIAEFMARHPSLEQFERYVMSDAHTLPKAPAVANINDQTTQHLPPLASEEYTAQVSRLTYLVRALQAIEAADPEFLSQTRVHLLLDLVLDLEQTFTLPRVDFLRRHASTIQAMGVSYSGLDNRDTDCAVGFTEDWAQDAPSASSNARHIQHMTRAILRHPQFRDSRDTSRATNNAPSRATHDTSILGNKLRLDKGAFEPAQAANLPTDAQPPSPKSSVGSNLDVSLFGSVGQRRPSAYVAPASVFDPKLHPVVGPQSMEVLPTLRVTNDSLSQMGAAQGKPLGSRQLRRRPQPGPELSPATSGGFSANDD
ncbi:hypothetical protein LPJ63_002702 [Coemansia sp. RSA 2711]|nr:hypothetical protein LPJ63_002702 [Coemansia sp. RSA 2711]